MQVTQAVRHVNQVITYKYIYLFIKCYILFQKKEIMSDRLKMVVQGVMDVLLNVIIVMHLVVLAVQEGRF